MFEIISLTSLVKSLELDRKGENHLISLVGGGGKTTLLHALGKQLSGRTILTSTTKMGSDQNNDLRTLMKPDAKAIESITNNETVMIWKKIVGEKAIGVEKQTCDSWFSYVDHVVVEADGQLEKAKNQIDVEKDKALLEIRQEVVDLSIEVAEKIIKKTVSKEDNAKIIDESLTNLKNYEA